MTSNTATAMSDSFTPAQVAEIRNDLEVIMTAHLDITDDKVAELLQFFNMAVNGILAGGTCDPKSIDVVLLNRFLRQVHLRASFLFICCLQFYVKLSLNCAHFLSLSFSSFL